MKRCLLSLFVIVLLSDALFAKETGVMILRGSRNVNALKGLEALKVSLTLENTVQGVQINTDEVKELFKEEIIRCLGGLDNITLFAEDAPALNVYIILESKPSGRDFIYSVVLNADIENEGEKWIFEYRCKTDKQKLFNLNVKHQDRFLKAYQDAKDNKLDSGDYYKSYIVNRSLSTLAFYLKKDYKSVN
jgi:hypothetical protein